MINDDITADFYFYQIFDDFKQITVQKFLCFESLSCDAILFYF